MDAERAAQNLRKRGFTVRRFANGAQAAACIAEELNGKTIGIGGSKTIETLGLYELLGRKNAVYWHWKQQPVEEIRRLAGQAEIYFSSANAIAETGEIVNIDGTGNRVASLCYGHERVYLIVGVNKLTPDLESALYRAHNIAAPLNTRRMGLHNPCAVGELRCHDCQSPTRVCRAVSILEQRPGGIPEMEIILIDEELGF